jgi:acetyl esterase/lipase
MRANPAGSAWKSFGRAALSLVLGSLTVLASSVPSGAAGPEILRGVQYVPGGTRHQVMDVYMPNGDGPFPGVVVIHGGGWTGGNTRDFAEESRLLTQEGFVAFAVDYRKAPRFTFPAQLDDMEAVVRFIREHAEEYKVNPAHLGALGGSAGGQLAALLGVVGHGRRDQDSRVNVVVSWSGPMDFTAPPPDRAAPRQDRPVGRGPVFRYLGCAPLVCPDLYLEASPVTHVDPSDAPTFLANGTAESVALSQPKSMLDALDEAEVPADLVEIPGKFHSVAYEFKKPPSLDGETVFQASVAWLHQYIDQAQAVSPSALPSPGDSSPEGAALDRALLFGAIAAILVVVGVTLSIPRMRRRR